MTRSSIVDYATAVRVRYVTASKRQKAIILKEFCETTGFHRKSAIRLLRRTPKPRLERRGRPQTYGPEVKRVLEVAWKAADHACSKRLAPFLPELVPVLERHGEIQCSLSVRRQLMVLSSSTIDRLLQPVRLYHLRHPHSHVSSPTVVRAKVPVRTFGQWSDIPAGHMQVDLVIHCGNSMSGFHLATLVAVDVVTGWTECVPVFGTTQTRVGGAVDRIRRCVPFPLAGLHSDNGGEFLNGLVWKYCQDHHIQFTRGRPYKKNDQAYVEQKNWQVIRRMIGYDRFATREAVDLLQQIYALVRLYVNFFQPISKLDSKERVGAKVRKRYDQARTPYQRLLKAKVLDEAKQRTLKELYSRLNPLRLLSEIEEQMERLKRMAVLDPVTKEILARKKRVLEETLERETKTAG